MTYKPLMKFLVLVIKNANKLKNVADLVVRVDPTWI